MTRDEIEVVVAAVEICRHRRDEVAAILAAVGLAQLQARDLGDRVPFVGRLERARKQRLLGHRLRCQLRIDAGRAQEHQLGDAGAPRRVHDVGLDREIVVEEFGRARVVGEDAADRRRRDEDRVGPRLAHPRLDRALVAQIELRAVGGDQGAARGAEPAHQRRAHHAAMARHPHFLAGEIEDFRRRHGRAVPHFSRASETINQRGAGKRRRRDRETTLRSEKKRATTSL
jgi:hypothetical protein